MELEGKRMRMVRRDEVEMDGTREGEKGEYSWTQGEGDICNLVGGGGGKEL
jgi:hypothetical protein